MLARIGARVFYNLPRRLRWKLAREFGGQPWRWVQWIYDSPGEYSLRPMRERNCIFIHVPKAAGTSIATSLFGGKGGAHASAADYLSVFGARWYDQAFKFAFVRDPWSRVVSAFEFLRKDRFDGREFHEDVRRFIDEHLSAYEDLESFVLKGLGRPEIMAWPHFRPQVRFLTDPRNGRLGVDFIGRYETLRRDYETICARLGVSAGLAERNITDKTNNEGAPAMSKTAYDKIAKIYGEDIERLGYRGFIPKRLRITSA